MKLLITWLVVCLISGSQARCTSNQFKCSNGDCIPSANQCDRDNHCADNSDEVGCVCHLGDIRLTGTGSNVSRGNVELCGYNQYYAICGNFWSSNDAKVVCRQLGFNGSIATTASQFGAATTTYLLTKIGGGCNGTESSIYFCPQRPVAATCTSANPAAVTCSSPYCPSTKFQCSNGVCIDTPYVCDGYNDCRDNADEINCTCTKGMVRLEGGATSAQGTVKVCFRNRWGQVCDTYWTDEDAKVVCGQLGYTGGNAVYGSGSPSFYWSDVGGCRGNESIITACAFTTPVQSCSSYAGVSCNNLIATNPTSTSPSVAAAIGGGVGGGILVLLVILCIICVSIYCLCKKSDASERVHKPPRAQPAPAQTEVPSGGTKIIVIQDSRPQNIMMPPVHYAQDPYYNTPQFEPYPAHPPYPIPPDGMGFPQHQSYNADPSSYFQGAPSATPYKPEPIPRKVPSAPRRQ